MGKIRFSPDSRVIARVSTRGELSLFSTSQGNLLFQASRAAAPPQPAAPSVPLLPQFSISLISVAFSPDGSVLATSFGSSSPPTWSTVRVFDVASGRELHSLGVGHHWVTALAFGENQDEVWSMTSAGLSRHELQTGRSADILMPAGWLTPYHLHSIPEETSVVIAARLRAGRRFLFTRYSPGFAIVDPKTGDVRSGTSGAKGDVTCADIFGAGNELTFVAGTDAGYVVRWRPFEERASWLSVSSKRIRALRFLPTGATLLALSEDGTLSELDTGTLRELSSFPGRFEAMSAASFDPSARLLAIEPKSRSGCLDIWDWESRSRVSGIVFADAP